MRGLTCRRKIFWYRLGSLTRFWWLAVHSSLNVIQTRRYLTRTACSLGVFSHLSAPTLFSAETVCWILVWLTKPAEINHEGESHAQTSSKTSVTRYNESNSIPSVFKSFDIYCLLILFTIANIFNIVQLINRLGLVFQRKNTSEPFSLSDTKTTVHRTFGLDGAYEYSLCTCTQLHPLPRSSTTRLSLWMKTLY